MYRVVLSWELSICICIYSIIRHMANTHLLRIPYSGKFLMEVIFKISKILKIQVTFKGAYSLNHCIIRVCSLVMGLCSHDLVVA